MAASYKLLHLDKEASKLISTLSMHQIITPDYTSFYDKLAHDAQYLFILSRHFPELLNELTGNDILQVINAVNSGSYNSFTSAYTIMALDAYADRVGQPGELKVTIKAVLGDKEQALTIPEGLMPEIDLENKIKLLKIDNQGETPIFHQTTEAGFDIDLPKEIVKQGIEIQREYHDMKGNAINKIKIGEEISVHIKIRAIDKQTHYNTAIVDLLPGGFDVVLDASRQNQGSFSPEYIDLREDRVLIFGAVSETAQEFIYKIKAGNKGTYVVPPTFAEGMYDRSVRALGTPTQMIVE